MMKLNTRKNKIVAALSLAAYANLMAVPAAFAGWSCRDYYASYVEYATSPDPTPVPVGVVIVGTSPCPHYHDHYPEYHDHDGGWGGGEHHGGGGSSDDGVVLAIIGVIAAGMTTTSLVEDAELQDARDMINIINDAQMGDGPALRTFVPKVQEKIAATVTENQVAAMIVRENSDLSFCQGGDLVSTDELATRIAKDLSSQAN